MVKSAEEERIGPAAQEPERRSVRRRLVQSTLFPTHKSPEIVESNGDRNGGHIECNAGSGEENGEVEELRGRQRPKRRKLNVKTPPQIKNSKKKVKEKIPVNCTPKKNENISTNLMEYEDASPPNIPNLRLEAKLTAEENSRMFAGRQVHPFFSSWKVGRRSQDARDGESVWCTLETKNKSTAIGPIHVFEKIQDEIVPIDWGNWTLCEETFSTTCHGEEGKFLPVFDATVKSFNIDKISCVSHCSDVSYLENKVHLNKCFIQLEDSPETSPAVSAVFVDDPQQRCLLLKESETVHIDGGDEGSMGGLMGVVMENCQLDEAAFCFGDAGCLRKSDVEKPMIDLQDRMRPCYLSCGNQPENNLWTVKYQPTKASEICGNNEAVKVMSEWLHQWHERDTRTIKDLTDWDNCNIDDDDYDCYGSDPDSEDIDEGTTLKNILLVTGPVGSGKSAAVYACAKEHGFKVFECNASEGRNGALVKVKLGEVLESQCLERSLENPGDSQGKHKQKSTKALPTGEAKQGCDDEAIELIHISDRVKESHGDTETFGQFGCNETKSDCNQGALKPLILFEDVDITFSEDRGFIASVQHIAKKAKGPVILTSNCDNSVLPEILDRLEVSFKELSPEELLCHLCMVSVAEQANIHPHSIERLIGRCQGDIRKAIMHLQFWCQGRGYKKDTKLQKACDSLLFDVEAGHFVLPKLIPWDFPSQLSEQVEKEIAMALSMMEENSTLMEVGEGAELDKWEVQNGLQTDNNDIEAKKEIMLSRNGSVQNCDEFVDDFHSEYDFFNPSGTPVSLHRQKIRRRAIVMSSDSEEELPYNGFLPVVVDKNTNNETLLEDSRSLSLCPNIQNCLNQLTDTEKQLCSEVNLKSFKLLETANDLTMNSICRSVDISCVPESSFVPETEINNGSELSSGIVACHVAETVEVSVGNELFQNFSAGETDNLDKSVLRMHKNSDVLGNTCDVITESSNGEEVEDSQNEHLDTATRGCQVMDECSRMVFNRTSQPMEKCTSCISTDLVQESWKKLRSTRAVLEHYATSEQKDVIQVLKLASRLSNVISEADFLLSKCQMPDSLQFPKFPSEESDTLSSSDEQLQMISTIAHHGFCFYAKDLPSLGLDIGSNSRVGLTWEKLASTTNMIAFGKLVGQDNSACGISNAGKDVETRPPEREISLKSEMESCLFDIIKPIVPSRSLLSLKGNAFHEYLSSLSCISRSEASRISDAANKTKKRRGCRAKHYLSTGALMFSPEEISLLGQYDYGKR
ncbi:hypothetical protein CFOL_v3_27570 [Cephalotus follicularis]|uniref:AAA domain-containing protein n=1 Tax=Cephalotus follicularis TaxID=3775 RepID=A0A1Q3CV47_CEPFO|nr:hypothetical protein CFOL_v3_27570 [Cephalotus follicularis]